MVFAIALIGSASAATAGNVLQCNNYSNNAVAQQGANVSKGCGFSGPRWQANYEAHFAWCMNASTPQINGERNARNAQLAACSGGGSGATTYKTFKNPKINNLRLDWCRVWASQCRKPAADQFCELKGYDKAISWNQDQNIGLGSTTKVIGTGQICNGPDCDGFKKIRCKKN